MQARYLARYESENIKTMINPLISYFDGGITNVTKSYKITIKKLHSGITSCEKWKNQIAEVRKVLEKYGKGEEYRAAKAKLPYFMPSGVWNNRIKGDCKLIAASNCYQIDVDNVLPDDMNRYRQILVNDKHTMLLFLSPSGRGWKGIGLHEPDKAPHRSSLEEFYKGIGIPVDGSTLFTTQPSYISYDPDAFLNLDADPFIFKEDNQQTPKKNGEGIVSYPQTSANANSPHVQSYCRKIIEQSAGYVLDAPKGTGSDILKKAAYKCGLYACYGLSKGDAAAALWAAYEKRQTGHTLSEFFRLFNFCFDAGKLEAKNNPPPPIKDRPPVQQPK